MEISGAILLATDLAGKVRLRRMEGGAKQFWKRTANLNGLFLAAMVGLGGGPRQNRSMGIRIAFVTLTFLISAVVFAVLTPLFIAVPWTGVWYATIANLVGGWPVWAIQAFALVVLSSPIVMSLAFVDAANEYSSRWEKGRAIAAIVLALAMYPLTVCFGLVLGVWLILALVFVLVMHSFGRVFQFGFWVQNRTGLQRPLAISGFGLVLSGLALQLVSSWPG